MLYLLLALACAIVGTLPLLVIRDFGSAFFLGIISTVLFAPLFYLFLPTAVYPLGGTFGFSIFFLWVIIAVLIGCSKERGTNTTNSNVKKSGIISVLLPIFFAGFYIVSFVMGSNMLRSSEYANMINSFGPMDKRVWTQDVQPKDPRHMAMVSTRNAIYVAKKVLGEAGAIGSQFEIATDLPTPQMFRGELWYMIPLDFAGFSVWTSTDGVPAYIMVHAEDPNRTPELVNLSGKEKMRFTPGAYFGNNLERHLRNSGYIMTGLEDYSFERDDTQGKVWWVVTTFKPTIMWSGKKITGVVIVDPSTGDIKLYPMGEIPQWIDRVVPKSYVQTYINWWGEYSSGWVNSWWGTLNLTHAEKPNLIYGSDNEPQFVSGVTSCNTKDDSLVALIYVHSRTGKTVYYETRGGGTDKAVLDAVNKNQEVQFRKLHGTYPQLYNVYGTMASVVPLMNESDAFQGVAIVNIRNVQNVAVGSDQHEALRIYQKLLSQSGQQITLEKGKEIEKASGLVDRFTAEVSKGTTIYYVHISSLPHLFTGGSELSAKLPVTMIGDSVSIEYVASGEDVVPIYKFDNLSFELSKTTAQKEVEKRVNQRKVTEETRIEKESLLEKIRTMSPEELKILLNKK